MEAVSQITCVSFKMKNYLWLFGPIFYQDNQWWGFVFYDEDFYENYRLDIPEFKVMYAFKSKFASFY